MKETIPSIIAMSITGFIFMTISNKYKWSKKVWGILNKKIKTQYNVAVWILFSAVFIICIQLLCEMLGIHYSNIIMGISLGFYFAFMPTLDK